MSTKINTTATLREKAKPEAELQAELNKAQKAIGGNVEMVDLMIPEAYRGYFSNPARFSVNGVTVEVPLGITVKVPKPHFLHAQRLMNGAVLSKNQKRLTPEEVYKN
jgi:hypothetical protein